MKNIVFTIVAENYLPLAQTLSWSLRNQNKTEVEFIIFVTDKWLGSANDYHLTDRVVLISELELENLEDMSFKYNVTEFATAVKPSCFKYVFDVLNADKVIYFDPDVFVFNSILPIFDDLESNEIVVTPHFITPLLDYVGDNAERNLFFEGIFNFGFVAFKRTDSNALLLDWWEKRLFNECYADRQDALHTDQKWGDFLPVYANDRLLISKSIGYNYAPWNLFEREVFYNDNTYWVRNRFTLSIEPLIFVHFAGYDPNNLKVIHKYLFGLTIDKYPEYDIVRNVYNEITNKYNFKEKKNSAYLLSVFSNGDYVQDYHRRFYRAITESGTPISKPFDSEGTFYRMLKKKGLIPDEKPQKYTVNNLDTFSSKRKKIELFSKMLLRVIGVKNYFMLMKFLNRFSRPENQTFLFGETTSKFY